MHHFSRAICLSMGVLILTLLPDAALAQETAYEKGRMMGGAIWYIVWGLGLLKAIQVARRPTSNTVCVLSLILIIVGLIGFNATRGFVPSDPPAMMALLLGFGLLIIAGVVLAIVGLAQYRGSGAKQGVGQAVSALILGGILLAGAGYGVYVSASGGHLFESSRLKEIASSERYEFAEENFYFVPPSSAYVNMDAKAINPDATFMLMRRRPEHQFFVVSEVVGEDFFDNQAMYAMVDANLRAVASDVTVSETRPYSVDEIDGLRFRATASIGGATLSFDYWVAEHNGYLYQLVSASQKDWKGLEKATDTMLQGFHLIDRNRVAGQQEGTRFSGFESQYGYHIEVDPARWFQWAESDNELINVDVEAMYDSDTTFAAASFCGDFAALGGDALDYALMRTVHVEFPEEITERLADQPIDGISARVYRAVDDVGDGTPFHNWLAVVEREQCAHLFAFWSTVGMARAETAAADLLAGVEFTDSAPDQTPPGVAAWFVNGAGLYYDNLKNWESSLEMMLEANELAPDKEVYFTNTLHALNRQDRYDEAIAFMAEHGEAFKDSAEVSSWAGWFAYQTGNYLASVDAYEKAFSQGYNTEEDLVVYLEGLMELERTDDAKAVLDEFGTEYNGADIVDLRVKVLLAQGDTDTALATVQSAIESRPFDVSLSFLHMDVLEATGDYAAIVDLGNALIERGTSTAGVHYRIGDAHYMLDQYVQAKRSLEAAMALAPGNETLEQYLRDVSAQLGEGDATAIQTEIAPVPWPSIPVEKLPDAGQHDSFYVSHSYAYRFEVGKPMRVTESIKVTVLDRGGIQRFSTLSFPFDPLAEKLYVNRLVVTDENGELVAEGDRSTFYVADAEEYDQATFDQTVYLPVPGLAPGYTIEIDVTTESLSPDYEFPFRRVYLSATRPVGMVSLYVEGDIDQIKYRSVRAPDPIQTERSLHWVIQQPQFSVREPVKLHDSEYLSSVLLGSEANWEKLVQDYRTRIADRVELTPAIRQLASELSVGAESAEEIVGALAEFVQSELTYKAIEFGSRGTIPNSPEKVLSDRFGDCKDHAVLLASLLQAADIQASLALVNTENPVEPDFPSLDQFNHMIVYVADINGGSFLDPTQKNMPLLKFPPRHLGDSLALLVQDDAKLAKIPVHVASYLNVERFYEVAESGNVQVNERISVDGYIAAGLRAHFKAREHEQRESWLQGFLADHDSRILLSDFEVQNLFAPSEEFGLEFSFVIDRRSDEAEPIVVSSGDYWESLYVRVDPDASRQSDFQLRYPTIVHSKVTYSAASEGLASSKVPENRSVTSEFGKFETRWRKNDSGVELVFFYEEYSGRYPAARFSEYQKFGQDALDAMRESVGWSVKSSER